MNTVKHPAVENTKRSCRKDFFFFRYKMPKTLSGDVAVRSATFLSSPVNSVGSFLKVPFWQGYLQSGESKGSVP